jgi:hypothetical protein
MADPVSSIAGSAAKSVRPFRSSEAYVEAMKEDLAEWLNALYGLGLPSGGDGFLTGLATGTTLCRHANAVTEAAQALAATRPTRGVAFQAHSVAPGSFVARDNVATFIGWCRTELGVPEVLMFETEDLVLRKNEKSVVLCLLEVARRGARLGLLAPRLVQFEQEIEQELRAAPPAPNTPAAGDHVTETATAPGAPTRGPRMTPSDLRNLDELVSGTGRVHRRPLDLSAEPVPQPVAAPCGGKGAYGEHQVCTRPRRSGPRQGQIEIPSKRCALLLPTRTWAPPLCPLPSGATRVSATPELRVGWVPPLAERRWAGRLAPCTYGYCAARGNRNRCCWEEFELGRCPAPSSVPPSQDLGVPATPPQQG